MMGQSAGRSKGNRTTGSTRATQRQRDLVDAPPGEREELLEAADASLWNRLLVVFAILTVGFLAAVFIRSGFITGFLAFMAVNTTFVFGRMTGR